MTSNRVTLLRAAADDLEAMSPEVQQEARGLMVLLAASPRSRLVRRIDIGMVNEDGLRIWGSVTFAG